MVWNEQQNPQSPTPPTPRGDQASDDAQGHQGVEGVAGPVAPVPPATAPAFAAPEYFANNPLKGVAIEPTPASVPVTTPPATGGGMAMGSGRDVFVPQPARQMPVVGLDDGDQVPADDVIWVNRAKRAIAETRGDPHRKVQLLQHLRSVYLRQKFGRNVHTDDVA